jgi:hypothetical protein
MKRLLSQLLLLLLLTRLVLLRVCALSTIVSVDNLYTRYVVCVAVVVVEICV